MLDGQYRHSCRKLGRGNTINMFYRAFCKNCHKENLFEIDNGDFIRIEYKTNGFHDLDGIDICRECCHGSMNELSLYEYSVWNCNDMDRCSLCYEQVSDTINRQYAMFAVCLIKDNSGWKHAICSKCWRENIRIYKDEWPIGI
jgi:hypothetical protein